MEFRAAIFSPVAARTEIYYYYYYYYYCYYCYYY